MNPVLADLILKQTPCISWTPTNKGASQKLVSHILVTTNLH